MTVGAVSALPEMAPLGRRVRLDFAGCRLADTERALRVIEGPHEVRYYLPCEDLDDMLLANPRHTLDHQGRGPAMVWTVAAGDQRAEGGAWSYTERTPGRPDLRGHVTFAWHAMDRMREEDQEVSVHPRNPYVRVDVLTSSRRLRIAAAGVVLADTGRSILLVETHQPDRWYVARSDVRTALLPSATRTECPYKGLAAYWSVDVAGHTLIDIAWSYPDSGDPSVVDLADAVAFDPARVKIWLDGRCVPRLSPTSSPAHLVGDWVRRNSTADGHGGRRAATASHTTGPKRASSP